MNLLFIMRNELLPSIGGVERVTNTITKILQKSNQNIYVIYTGIQEISEPEQHDGIEYSFLPDITNLGSPQNFNFIRDLILKNGINIAINQNANYAIAKHLAGMRNNELKIISCLHTPPLTPRLLFEYHLASSFQSGLAHWTKAALKYVLRTKLEIKYFKIYLNELLFTVGSSDATVVPANQHIGEYRKILPSALNANLVVINHPLSFPKQNLELLLQNKEKIILAVSRLERTSKRIDLLLRAWSKIHRKHSDWKLVIVGGPKHIKSDDPQFRELQKLKFLIRKLKIGNVVFAGNQNPMNYYEKSSIYTMTSASEAWGMSLVEAQQFGCVPVVFQSFSALQEIISPGENGFCVPFPDIDGFAEAISLLIDDRILREKIARCAEKSTSRFRQEKIGKDWLNLFETMNSDLAPDKTSPKSDRIGSDLEGIGMKDGMRGQYKFEFKQGAVRLVQGGESWLRKSGQ